MARIDVESFKAGIADKNEKIAKLTEQRDKLLKKIKYTIKCPTCENYWDSMYWISSFKSYEQNKEDPYFLDEVNGFKLECPLCKTRITVEYDRHVFDKSENIKSCENKEQLSETKMFNVKNIFEELNAEIKDVYITK